MVGIFAALGLYAAFIVALLVAGRRSDASALARFIPDCIVLVKRLIQDERVSRSRKFALAAIAAYLALPIDLIPDFIPVAGQLDDVILLALTLRFVLSGAGDSVIRELWPGPSGSLKVVLSVSGSRATKSSDDQQIAADSTRPS